MKSMVKKKNNRKPREWKPPEGGWMELSKECEEFKKEGNMFTICRPDMIGGYISEIINGKHIKRRQYRWKYQETFIHFFEKVIKVDNSTPGIIEALSLLNALLYTEENYPYTSKEWLEEQIREFTEYFIILAAGDPSFRLRL